MTKEDFYNIAKTHFENSKIVSKEEFDTALDVYANENGTMPWTLTKAKMPDHDGAYLVLHREPYDYFDICSFSKRRKNLYPTIWIMTLRRFIIPKKTSRLGLN